MRDMMAPGRLGAVAAFALVLSAFAAPAQDIVIEAPAPVQNALTEEEQEALRQALSFDALQETKRAAGRPALPSAPAAAWNRNDKPDGSAAVGVKRPLPTAWETSVGADFGLAAPPVATYAPDRPWRTHQEQSTGAAWANLKVPNLASFDARLGANAPSRIGATFGRTLPVGGGNAITLENSYAVTETLAAMPPADPGTGVTLPAASLSGSSAPPPARIWSTARAVKLDIGATGTTLAASAANSSTDNVTHSRFSAEQKLTGALSLTAAVTDPGAPTAGKSIGAAFKWKW